MALTEPEARALLANINHFEEKTLLALAISTGIRREDIVALEIKDIDLERGEIKFWEAKKKRTWMVWISGETRVLVHSHVNTLPRGVKWLFPSRPHPERHISGRTAYNILQRWLKVANIGSRPFHALRSTCIKICQKRGWTPEQVMALTGDTWRTIQLHYATPTTQEMVEVAASKPIL